MADRIFDVEFAPVNLTITRVAGQELPFDAQWTGSGSDEELLYQDGNGRAVFYQQIDLQQLTKEGRAFKPEFINVQRPWNAPQGQDANFNPSTDCVELLYVFLNPLPNDNIRAGIVIDQMRDLGLDSSNAYDIGVLAFGAIPDASNCLFAQSTRYINNIANANSTWNGFAVATDVYYPLLTQTMSTAEQNTWGGMHTILGPMLHCYRVIIHPTQIMTGLSPAPAPDGNPLVLAAGSTLRKFSPISISIYAEEMNLSSGEYIIEASNAFNSENYDAPSNR